MTVFSPFLLKHKKKSVFSTKTNNPQKTKQSWPSKNLNKKRNNKFKSNKKTKLLSLIAVSVFTGLVYVGIMDLFPKFIKINEISCFNQYNFCGEDIVQSLINVEGKTLFNARRNIKNILSNNLMVKSYSFHYRPPSKISIYIIEKKIKFALFSKPDRNFGLIDDEGFMIKHINSTGLPYLVIETPLPEIEKKLEAKELFALNLIFDTNTISNIRIAYIRKNSLVIELDDSPDVIFPLEGERDLLVGSLNLILAQLNTLDNNLKDKVGEISNRTIDLRYEKPVIR